MTPVNAETVTLVAFGDSLTAGYGLTPDAGLVPQLQGWLTAQGVEVAVVNAGVSGDTTAGGLARLDWSLTSETDALMVTLGGNDMLRGLPPEEAKGNLRAGRPLPKSRQIRRAHCFAYGSLDRRLWLNRCLGRPVTCRLRPVCELPRA